MSKRTKEALIVLVVVLVLVGAFGFWQSRASAQVNASKALAAATDNGVSPGT